MEAEAVLRWAYSEFGDRLCLTCSWQRQSSVLVHMVSGLGLDIPVVELDTELLFPETYATRAALVERYGLKLIRPGVLPIAAQHKAEGPNLWERDPDRCCHIRKVVPLAKAVEGYEAWISAIRRDQTPDRAASPIVGWDRKFDLVKVNPLANWSKADVWAYIRTHDVPSNPLNDLGYPTVGCWPCTRAVKPGEDERAGRWAGKAKTECGLHSHSGTVPTAKAA